MRRPVAHTDYHATDIAPALLLATLERIGGVNVSSLTCDIRQEVTPDQIHALTGYLLSIESGERHPVGLTDLIALYLLSAGRPYTLLAIDDYPTPYPVLVDGHTTSRDAAIAAWLGDADASEHPLLHLSSLTVKDSAP